MVKIDVEALRAQVQAMDFMRGTPDEVARWRGDDEDSRGNIMLEGIRFEPEEDALFAMMTDEGVPPATVTRIILQMLGARSRH